MFVQTGWDVTLDVNENITLKPGNDFLWKHNYSNILKYNGNQVFNYRNATFNKEEFSLQLKNVKAEASGSYTAVVSGQEDSVVAEYQVTVLGESLICSDCDTRQNGVSTDSLTRFLSPLPQTR